MGLAAAAAGTAVILVFKKMVKQYVETGDMIHKMAIRTGFAAETLSELAYAADISGADITMLEKGVKKMSKTIVDAGYGLETYLRVFRSLGLEIDDLMAMDPEEQFLTIGAAIADMENDTLKTAAAVDVFGRAGTMLLPFFAEGAEGIAKLREEAHTLGIIFDEEAAAKAAKLKDAQTALKGSIQGLSIAILNDLIPVITGVTKNFTDWFVGSREHAGAWTKSLLGAFQFIAKGIEGLLLAWYGLKTGVFLVAEALTKSIVKIAEGLLWIAKLTPGTEIFYAETLRDIIRDLTFVSEGYREEKEKGIDTMTDIIMKYEKFVATLKKVKKGVDIAKEAEKSWAELILEQALPTLESYEFTYEKMVEKVLSMNEELMKSWGLTTEAQLTFTELAMSEFINMEASIKGFVNAILGTFEKWAIGQIIPKIMAALPFPFNLLATGGAILAIKSIFAGIKSMEEGGTIEHEGIYHLHRGEEVVPASPAASAIGSRSAVTYNINFRVQALDSVDVERWFRDVGAKQIEEIFRRNQGGVAEKSERYLSQYRR